VFPLKLATIICHSVGGKERQHQGERKQSFDGCGGKATPQTRNRDNSHHRQSVQREGISITSQNRHFVAGLKQDKSSNGRSRSRGGSKEVKLNAAASRASQHTPLGGRTKKGQVQTTQAKHRAASGTEDLRGTSVPLRALNQSEASKEKGTYRLRRAGTGPRDLC